MGHPGTRSRPPGGTSQSDATDPARETHALPAFAHTLASYFDAFSPAPAWDELCDWPPDVFALTNLVLDHTEAYRFVVAPPAGRHWPPASDWNEAIKAAAEQWRQSLRAGDAPPSMVQEHWDVVTRCRGASLEQLRSGHAWASIESLLTLHSLADEACSCLAGLGTSPAGSLEARAWGLISDTHSLSRVSPARIRVTPKTLLAGRGITIRSLSRYLALAYESVDVVWRHIEPETQTLEDVAGQSSYNVVLVPWPLSIDARDFRPVPSPLKNMDEDRFGFFEFAPERPFDLSYLDAILRRARREAGSVDAVILPESAIDASEIAPLEDLVAHHDATFLICGVRETSKEGGFGKNYVHFGVRTTGAWESYRQSKHHRWLLDEAQIRQYHLTRALDPHKMWWEAIELPARCIQVIDVGGGATTAPLICEDLARMDEVTDLLRRIGPTVVVTLLLDGPQLQSRWSCRYAGVLADEPGSAVLTLTSFGMAARSRPPGLGRSRIVASWTDPSGGRREIPLGRGAGGVLIEASVNEEEEWTADGRRHCTPNATLSAIHQLHPE